MHKLHWVFCLSFLILTHHNLVFADGRASDLYSCARKIGFGGGLIDIYPLGEELFAIYDSNKAIIYIYSEHFAHGTSIKQSPLGSTKSADGKRYNVRIPYHSTKGSDKNGFYYATANTHNDRINIPPKFLPGAAQDHPDFTKIAPTKNGVTFLGFDSPGSTPSSSDVFYPLTFEEEIWKNRDVPVESDEAKNVLTTYVLKNLPEVPRSLQRIVWAKAHGMRFADGASDSDKLKFESEAKREYHELITECTSGAQKVHSQSIQTMIQSMPKDLMF